MVFEPIYIPWALSTGTCIQQGGLFYSAGLHRNQKATPNTGKKLREVWETAQVNDWKGRNKQGRNLWQ